MSEGMDKMLNDHEKRLGRLEETQNERIRTYRRGLKRLGNRKGKSRGTTGGGFSKESATGKGKCGIEAVGGKIRTILGILRR